MAKILVVEDDPATLRLATLHLESASHEVLSAEDGMQGLTQAICAMPDLIVCDCRMPAVDGFGLLAGLRNNAPTSQIPVIFLTAVDDPAFEARAFLLGVSDFLRKPLERASLLEAVANQLRQVSRHFTELVVAPDDRMAQSDMETMEVARVCMPAVPDYATTELSLDR